MAQLSDPASYDLRQIDRVRVKGKLAPTTIYECFATDQIAVREKKKEMQGRWATALQEYYARQFKSAQTLFNEIDTAINGDKIAKLYVRRCEELAVAELAADWDGTHSHKSK